jgi:hypothetical protein
LTAIRPAPLRCATSSSASNKNGESLRPLENLPHSNPSKAIRVPRPEQSACSAKPFEPTKLLPEDAFAKERRQRECVPAGAHMGLTNDSASTRRDRHRLERAASIDCDQPISAGAHRAAFGF